MSSDKFRKVNTCKYLFVSGSMQGWRHLAFILKEALWDNDRWTEFHTKLKRRAMLPGHRWPLPTPQCYFWRRCGVGSSEHALICEQRQMRILWVPASTIVNRQSSHFGTWLMSQVDMLGRKHKRQIGGSI